jgi:uncharacterized protein YkwD
MHGRLGRITVCRVLRHSLRFSLAPLAAALVVVLQSGMPVAASNRADSTGPGRRIFVPLALARAEAAPPVAAPTPNPAPATPVSFEQRVADLVNQQRAINNLPALTLNTKLMAAARAHSQDMAEQGFFSHTGSNGSDVGDRISATGYDWTSYGENIAAGYATPENVVDGWMKSDGHRENILSANVTELGVGYVAKSGSPYTHYWTNDFAAP